MEKSNFSVCHDSSGKDASTMAEPGNSASGPRISAAASLTLAASLSILLAVVFFHFGVPFLDTFTYAAGILFLVYIPGRVVLRFSGVETGGLEAMVLSLLLGLTTTTILNKFARILGVEILFFLWIAFCVVYAVYRAVKRPPQPGNSGFRITPSGLGFGLVLLAVFAILFMDNYHNCLPRPDGSRIVNMRYHDGFMRNAVVRELSHSVPPQMPFAAGFPLSYHYGMDLFNAIFYRHLRIDVLDLNYRLSLTLFFVLLSLMLFVLLKELAGSSAAAALGSGLALFGGGGFSYLATLFWGIPQWGNIFYSFYFINFINLNSFLPGLAILFSGFFALARFFRFGNRGWLILSVLLFAGAFEYKMFFAIPVFGALTLTAVYSLAFRRGLRPLKALFWTGICFAPLLVTAWLSNSGGPKFFFRLKFVDWFIFMLKDLQLAQLFPAWRNLVLDLQINPVTIGNAGLIAAIFFIGGFGLNLLGVPLLWRKVCGADREGPMPIFLGGFIAVCIGYFFLVDISLGGMPRSYVNIYVYGLASLVLCLFWSEQLATFIARKRFIWKFIIVGLVFVLSVPNTAWLICNKVRDPNLKLISRDFLKTADWLNANTRPDDVVVNSAENWFICYFADRRVVLDDNAQSFPTWHMTNEQFEERKNDIARFFAEPRLNADVLAKYGVRYVWALRGEGLLGDYSGTGSAFPCFEELKTTAIRQFRKTCQLERVFRKGPNALYRVQILAKEKQPVLLFEEKDGVRTLTTFAGHLEAVF
jgi:hypothetical protein